MCKSYFAFFAALREKLFVSREDAKPVKKKSVHFSKTLKIEENVSLAPLTSLRIGGRARFFVRAENEHDVLSALERAREKDLEVFVLGGGSNLLVSDDGFDGLVLQVALKGIKSVPPATAGGSDCLIIARAGEDWDPFVKYCVDENLAGIECLSGIPGFVGGTPVQNVGAYGQEVSETILSVRCVDRASNEIVELSNDDCGFSYRTSIFNSTKKNRYVVLSVTYRLVAGGEPKLTYKDLSNFFAGQKPNLGQVRDAVLKIRREKSMVIDASDPNSRSAGSFFKNPVVDVSKLEEIRQTHEGVPHFAFGERVKIPAAWLIENAGFQKGYVLGNAGISSNHTLAIINRGNATAAEIVVLKDEIQTAVAAKFGIDLITEPVFVGF